VCDPIDGTIPFSHGYPIFTFSLALTKNGESILAVVYDPINDRLFTAEKGKGAYLNGTKISVSTTSDFSKTCLISLDAEDRFPLLRQQLMEKNCRVVNLYSCVYLSMLVASGEFVAQVFGHNNPWDAAAVKVIVEEAGGKVTNLLGEEQLYNQFTNGFIASNGAIHEKLAGILKPLLS
jgi:myo-inositol-1(or 4)-monophosphatase